MKNNFFYNQRQQQKFKLWLKQCVFFQLQMDISFKWIKAKSCRPKVTSINPHENIVTFFAYFLFRFFFIFLASVRSFYLSCLAFLMFNMGSSFNKELTFLWPFQFLASLIPCQAICSARSRSKWAKRSTGHGPRGNWHSEWLEGIRICTTVTT